MDELMPRVVHPNDARPKCTTTVVDHARAERLRVFTRQYPKWGNTRSPKVWVESFALLRRSLPDDAPIDAVLDWYIGWYTPEKRPTVANGKQFRDRWDWLLQIWEREQSATVPVSALSPEARWVYDEVTELVWNATANAQLPGAIRDSLENIDAFEAALSRAVLPQLFNVVRDVVETQLADPRVYTARWFAAVWKRVHNWMDWSGNLMREVWTPRHPAFARAVQSAVAGQTGIASEFDWDTFINLVESKK